MIEMWHKSLCQLYLDEKKNVHAHTSGVWKYVHECKTNSFLKWHFTSWIAFDQCDEETIKCAHV